MTTRHLMFALLAVSLMQGCARAPAAATDGTRLFVDCRGARGASPTVILESGAFGTAADWDLVLGDLAHEGRACAYDRAGMGRSPRRTGGQDVTAIARELKALLDQIGEDKPVILAGHSNGALYAETFAAMWPDKVAGLLYVNGVTSDDLNYPELLRKLAVERRLAHIAALCGQMGLAAQVSDALAALGGYSGEAARRKRQDLAAPSALWVALDEDRAVVPGLTTVRNLGSAPAVAPVAVVSGSTNPDSQISRSWLAAEQAPALRAAKSLIVTVPNATHTSPLGRDRAYVVDAVRWLRSAAEERSTP